MSATLPAVRPRGRAQQGGLSLIELLVSMAIGLFLVATIGFAYVGARQSFRTQDASSRSQENARYAFEIIGSDVHMAGFSGGPDIPAGGYAPANTTIANNTVISRSNLYHASLWGYDAGTAFTGCAIGACRSAGTDALTVIFADSDQPMGLSASTATTFTLDGGAATAPVAGGIYVAADHTNSSIFAATAVAGTVVTHAGGLGGFGAIGTGSLYPLRGYTYYIGTNASGEPALYRQSYTNAGVTQTEELIEGISDMQITYGVDTTPIVAPATTRDFNIDVYCATAAEVSAGACGGTAIPADAGQPSAAQGFWKRVDSVRITLTTLSRTGNAATTTGGQMRRNYTTTFAIRNRRP